VKELDGSLAGLASAASDSAFIHGVFPAPTRRAVGFLGGLLALQLFLLLVVPGCRFQGPRAPSGHVPSYTANGFAAFLCTLGVLGALCARGVLSPTLIYDELGPIMTTLNGAALAASLLLYVKGLRWPSTADAGSSGSALMDVYWGTELYPRVWGVDLKQLLIARYGIALSTPSVLFHSSVHSSVHSSTHSSVHTSGTASSCGRCSRSPSSPRRPSGPPACRTGSSPRSRVRAAARTRERAAQADASLPPRARA